jgi:Flp pilus assembly protein TadG
MHSSTCQGRARPLPGSTIGQDRRSLCTGKRRPLPVQSSGAIAIIFSLMLIVLVGFIGLAFDLAQMYNRKVELQTLANASALAAARELAGTSTGITNAVNRASTTANAMHFKYDQQDVTWSADAIKFSPAASGPAAHWVDASTAMATPQTMLFAKVDTDGLDAKHGTVETFLMGLLYPEYKTLHMSGSAIAGRSSIKVTPLAICAMSAIPAASRLNAGPPPVAELEEYGFRRGVAYDLMNLNANGATAESFVVNPIDPSGSAGLASNTSPAIVGPFTCTGSIPKTRLRGAGNIPVGRPFPLDSLYVQLNSRFDQYAGGPCSASNAPPDFNIKPFTSTSLSWMAATPKQAAVPLVFASQLTTIAAPLPAPPGTAATDYGPLWSFSKAVAFSAVTPGVPEPFPAGYATLPTTSWSTLYNPGKPSSSSSLSSAPYMAASGTNYQTPSTAHKPGQRGRRVLNIPLLSCPVSSGSNVTANVLAIGKFFMTVPATTTSIYAEFAGVVPEENLGGKPELYHE